MYTMRRVLTNNILYIDIFGYIVDICINIFVDNSNDLPEEEIVGDDHV